MGTSPSDANISSSLWGRYWVHGLVLLFLGDQVFRNAYGGSDLITGSYFTVLVLFILILCSVFVIATGLFRALMRRGAVRKQALYSLLLLTLVWSGVKFADYLSLQVLKIRIDREKIFSDCVRNAQTVAGEGSVGWCEKLDQSGPVGSYNLFVVIAYDSTDQISLPYEKRSKSWQKVAYNKHAELFKSSYDVHKISGHFYRIRFWADNEKGGDLVDGSLLSPTSSQ